MKKFNLIIIFICYGLVSATQAQQSGQYIIDSLTKKLPELKEDTNKVKTFLDISFYYPSMNPDSGIFYGNKALELSEKLKYDWGIASANRCIGMGYNQKSQFPKALEQYFKGLKKFEAMKDKAGIAKITLSMALVYSNQLDFENALKCYSKSLKVFEEMGNKPSIAITLNNIGIVYSRKENYPKAEEYYLKALQLNEELGNTNKTESNISNLANVYTNTKNYNKALTYYFNALNINNKTGNKNYRAVHLSSIGNIYHILVEDNVTSELQSRFGGNKQKALQESKKYLDSAIVLYTEMGNINDMYQFYETLSSVHELLGNKNEALEFYKKYVSAKDSLFNQENTKKTLEMQMQYTFDKKSTADSIKMAEGEKVVTAQLEVEKTKKYGLYIGVLFLIAFAIFMINRFKIISKQKNIIELKEHETQRQKDMLDQKQKEILQSMYYAKRIQHSLLAKRELLKNNLLEHFVLYLPKDIVSGDFYWAAKKNDSFYLAVCDCTGHGVPGAFMSLLNINYLNEALIEKNILEPNEIFNYVRNKLITNIEGGHDGMDATLLRFEKNKITYASANNKPMLSTNNEIQDLNTDKMPIGKGESETSFTLFDINANKGDTIYLATDGYSDQFGHDGQKKLTRKKFKDLVITFQTKSLPEQGIALDKFIFDYRKDVEQIDDILVIGVRI